MQNLPVKVPCFFSSFFFSFLFIFRNQYEKTLRIVSFLFELCAKGMFNKIATEIIYTLIYNPPSMTEVEFAQHHAHPGDDCKSRMRIFTGG